MSEELRKVCEEFVVDMRRVILGGTPGDLQYMAESFAKQQRAEAWGEAERLCDELGAGDAKSDYGIGYQNAMKEISVHCESQAKALDT